MMISKAKVVSALVFGGLFILWAVAAFSSIVDDLPKRWQYGEPVYGHECNWNFDEILSRFEELDAVASSVVVASLTQATAATQAYVLFDPAAVNYLTINNNSCVKLHFEISAIATSTNNNKFGKSLDCVVFRDTASGTTFVEGQTSTTWGTVAALSADWDVVASVSSGKFHLLASVPANVKIFARGTLAESKW